MAVTGSTPFNLPPHISADEYFVVLVNTSRFDWLLRKDDFLDDGVSAVFGFAGPEAELLSLSFHAGKFTPAQVTAWLAERRFTLSVDLPILGGRPAVELMVKPSVVLTGGAECPPKEDGYGNYEHFGSGR